MKTAAKVFLIIGLVFQSLWFGLLLLVFLSYTDSLTLFYMIFPIVPIVVSSLALSLLSKAKSKSELTPIAVILLFFGNMIAGIIMLCMRESDFQNSSNQSSYSYQHNNASTSIDSGNTGAVDDFSRKLSVLKDAYDKGILTREEYLEKKKAMFDKELNK